MRVQMNPDSKMVQMLKEGLKKTGGYCPCKREQIDENKCMCMEFRRQIEDENFEGFCHCRLYLKTKD